MCRYWFSSRANSDTDRPPYKADSKRSWFVCGCATLANGLVHSVVLSFGVMLPVLMREFKANKERTALVGSLAYAVGCFTGPFAGRLCDRFGYQRTHVFGTYACALSLLVSSWATSPLFLYFSYSVAYGLGMSSTFMPCFLVVSKYFRSHRCFAVGMVTAGPAAGIFVMGPLLQELIDSVGWRHSYRILSGVFALSCFLSCPFNTNVEGEEDEEISTLRIDGNHGNHDSISADPRRRTRDTTRKLLDFTVCKMPLFMISLFSMCFAGIGHFSPPIHLVRYSEEIGYTAQEASYLFLSIGVGSVVARLLMGKICDLSWVSPIFMNQLSMMCSGAAILLLNARGGYAVLMVISLVYGLADGVYMTTFNVIVVNTVGPEQRSHAFGFANMALASCVCSAPALTGLIADRLSYMYAFYIAGGIALLGAMIPFTLKCSYTEVFKAAALINREDFDIQEQCRVRILLE